MNNYEIYKQMKKSFTLLPPIMPNFIKVQIPNSKDSGISVEDLTKEEAEEYAELMKKAFIEHWKKKVESKMKEKNFYV